MGSCKCRRGLSDPWSACFYCLYVVFSVFLRCDVLPKKTDADDDDDDDDMFTGVCGKTRLSSCTIKW